MSEDNPPGLQAFYTYAELAKAMSISRERVERLCRNENLTTSRVGNRHVIWLADIEAHLPKMFKSLMMCYRARQTERFTESLRQGTEAAAYGKAVGAEFERNGHDPH